MNYDKWKVHNMGNVMYVLPRAAKQKAARAQKRGKVGRYRRGRITPAQTNVRRQRRRKPQTPCAQVRCAKSSACARD